MRLMSDAQLRRVADQVRRLAAEAAALAGTPGPAAGMPLDELLAAASTAMSAAREAQANEVREASRRAAVQSGVVQVERPNPAGRAALTLADLRDRLRLMTGADSSYSWDDQDDPGGALPWVLERLDEAMRQLDVSEFADTGPVDHLRHRAVDRRPADAEHPPGTIAASVRSGLLLGGVQLRPQQVVVYVSEDPDE